MYNFFTNKKNIFSLIFCSILVLANQSNIYPLLQRDIIILKQYIDGLPTIEKVSTENKINTAVSFLRTRNSMEMVKADPNSKKTNIIDLNTIKNLNIYEGENQESPALVSLIGKHTKTIFGKIENALAHDIKRKSVNKLKLEKKLLSELLENEELFFKLREKLENLHKLETDFLEKFTEILDKELFVKEVEEITTSKRILKNYILSPIFKTASSCWHNLEMGSYKQTLADGISTFAYAMLMSYDAKNPISLETLTLKGASAAYFYNTVIIKTLLKNLPLTNVRSVGTMTSFLPIIGSVIPYSPIKNFLANIGNVGKIVEKGLDAKNILKLDYLYNITSRIFNNLITNDRTTKNQMVREAIISVGKFFSEIKKLHNLLRSKNGKQLVKIVGKPRKKLKTYASENENFYSEILFFLENEKKLLSHLNDDTNLKKFHIGIIRLLLDHKDIYPRKSIIDLFRAVGRIDSLAARASLCLDNENCNLVAEYLRKKHFYCRMRNVVNPLTKEDMEYQKISNVQISYWLKRSNRTKSSGFVPHKIIQLGDLKTIINNLILAHLGISFSEVTKLTPIDHILSTPLNNNNDSSSLERLLKDSYALQEKSGPNDKNLFIINNNNKLLHEENKPEITNLPEFIRYQELIERLYLLMTPISEENETEKTFIYSYLLSTEAIN